jgi:hypothetical protein
MTSDSNILKNEAAMAIIKKAKNDLMALGVPSLVAPTELPQGMSVSLHVASSEDAVYAALAAMNEGAGVARQVSTHKEFEEKVATMAANFSILDGVEKKDSQG